MWQLVVIRRAARWQQAGVDYAESWAVGTSPPEKQADKRQNKPVNNMNPEEISKLSGMTISAACLHDAGWEYWPLSLWRQSDPLARPQEIESEKWGDFVVLDHT